MISPNPVKGNTVNIEHHLSLDKAIIRLARYRRKDIIGRLYHIIGNNIRLCFGKPCSRSLFT